MHVQHILCSIEQTIRNKFFPFEGEETLFEKLETEGYSFGKWFPEENGYKSCYFYSKDLLAKYVMCLWKGSELTIVMDLTPEGHTVIPVVVSDKELPKGIQRYISSVQEVGEINSVSTNISNRLHYYYNPYISTQKHYYMQTNKPFQTDEELTKEEFTDFCFLAKKQSKGQFHSESSRTKKFFIAFRKAFTFNDNKIIVEEMSEKKRQNLAFRIIKELWTNKGYLIVKGIRYEQKFSVKRAFEDSPYLSISEILETYVFEDIFLKYKFLDKEKFFKEEVYDKFVDLSKTLFQVKGEEVIKSFSKRYQILIEEPEKLVKEVLKALDKERGTQFFCTDIEEVNKEIERLNKQSERDNENLRAENQWTPPGDIPEIELLDMDAEIPF